MDSFMFAGAKYIKFNFVSSDRTAFDGVGFGDDLEVVVGDEKGQAYRLKFKITRNTLLGVIRRIYGEVLTREHEYYEIKISLTGVAHLDTIEAFLATPPVELPVC